MRVFPGRGLIVWSAAMALLSGALLIDDRVAMVLLCVGWAVGAGGVAKDFVWLRNHLRPLDARVSVPASAIRGDIIDAALMLENQSKESVRVRARPLLPPQGAPNVWETAVSVDPGSVATAPIAVTAVKRGTYVFGDIHLRMQAPYAMLQSQWRVPFHAACRVFPDIERVKEYIVSRRFHTAFAPHMHTARVRGVGSEFESMRDYEEGDDIRHIDWKATAKHRHLIMRNYEVEHFRNVMLVLDRGRLMAGRAALSQDKPAQSTKLDHAIDAALMVAGVALEDGDRCGLLLFDQNVAAFLPPRSGTSQLTSIVEALYDVQPTLIESHFREAFIYLQTRLTKRSLVVVMTDVIDVEASRALITGVMSLSRRHLVMLVALRTPEVERVVHEPVADVGVPFRKAVAFRLLEERGVVMARLQNAGVHVLDLDPASLTIPMVNKYIELRENNLL